MYELITGGLHVSGLDVLGALHEALLCLARNVQAEFGKGARATAILGGTGPVTSDAEGIAPLRLQGENLLDPDLMLPEVVKIVLIEKPLTGPEPEIG